MALLCLGFVVERRKDSVPFEQKVVQTQIKKVPEVHYLIDPKVCLLFALRSLCYRHFRTDTAHSYVPAGDPPTLLRLSALSSAAHSRPVLLSTVFLLTKPHGSTSRLREFVSQSCR